MSEKTSRHHVVFPRKAHERESRVHRATRNLGGLLIPMPVSLHNDGENALHNNVFGVPLLPEYLAGRAYEVVQRNITATNYLRNLDILALAYDRAALRAFNQEDRDISELAAQAVLEQRSYVADAVGKTVGVYLLSEDLEIV